MKDQLEEAEEQALINSRNLSEYMYKQWETCAQSDKISLAEKRKIFHNILKRIAINRTNNKLLFYKLSLAASFLLIIGLSVMAYMFSSNLPLNQMYVISSGIRNMESVTLPDGTTVQLGAGSKLTYPERFYGKTREVTLHGQAFFDVAHNEKKPFIVHTPQMDLTVLGTAFELFSYDVENTIEIILLKGKVKANIAGDLTNEAQELFILPDDKIVFDKHTRSICKETVNADKYTSWRKNGILCFENEKLSMIIPRLEQWYGRHIICQKDIAERYRFTFKVRDETLERILYMIEKSSPLKYTKTPEGDFTIYLK